jgi:cytoskeletal protein CcmA (bactofilin family)
MFKSSKMAKNDPALPLDKSINTINQGSSIEGNITSNGNFRFDGELKGSIESKGKVVIGPSGKVEGNITCRDADISGEVKGIIKVSELTELKATAKVDCDLYTGKLSIEPGAVFSGKCIMGNIKTAPATQVPDSLKSS